LVFDLQPFIFAADFRNPLILMNIQGLEAKATAIFNLYFFVENEN